MRICECTNKSFYLNTGVNDRGSKTHTRVTEAVYVSKMGKYRVYYTWSFIHHKLLFVTYYMFWDNINNTNNKKGYNAWYKSIQLNGARWFSCFEAILLYLIKSTSLRYNHQNLKDTYGPPERKSRSLLVLYLSLCIDIYTYIEMYRHIRLTWAV